MRRADPASRDIGADRIARKGLVCGHSNAAVSLREKPLMDARDASGGPAPQCSAPIAHFVNL